MKEHFQSKNERLYLYHIYGGGRNGTCISNQKELKKI